VELKKALEPFAEMVITRTWVSPKILIAEAREYAKQRGLCPTQDETEETIRALLKERNLSIESILRK